MDFEAEQGTIFYQNPCTGMNQLQLEVGMTSLQKDLGMTGRTAGEGQHTQIVSWEGQKDLNSSSWC